MTKEIDSNKNNRQANTGWKMVYGHDKLLVIQSHGHKVQGEGLDFPGLAVSVVNLYPEILQLQYSLLYLGRAIKRRVRESIFQEHFSSIIWPKITYTFHILIEEVRMKQNKNEKIGCFVTLQRRLRNYYTIKESAFVVCFNSAFLNHLICACQSFYINE